MTHSSSRIRFSFYCWMAVAIAATAFVGFSRSFFLKHWTDAPPLLFRNRRPVPRGDAVVEAVADVGRDALGLVAIREKRVVHRIARILTISNPVVAYSTGTSYAICNPVIA